jgi:transglutaminase-like putative cysteine protease
MPGTACRIARCVAALSFLCYNAGVMLRCLSISFGRAGTYQTLVHMAAIAREYRKDELIRSTALAVVANVEGRNYVGEINAVYDWVQQHIAYRQDIADAETVSDPVTTLRTGQGDCDDQSVLVAALLLSIGHPCRFAAIGMGDSDSFQHVYCETRVGNRWYPMDTTEPLRPGIPPGPYNNIMRVYV